MKYFSMFSGIGGFELGIQQAYDSLSSQTEKERIGETDSETIRSQANKSKVKRPERLDSSGSKAQQHPDWIRNRQPTCIGYSEIDKYAIQIYEKQFPRKGCDDCQRHKLAEPGTGTQNGSTSGDLKSWGIGNQEQNFTCKCTHKNYGNATLIDPTTLPDFNLLVGGFPCQAFSIAGKRQGFADTRGTLFFDIARILRTKQPRLLLLENVKGLLSHDNGRTFTTIIATLDELGYDLQWQVLNSKNFGVPQNRERVFIVGHLRGTSRPQVFPIRESNPIGIKELNHPRHSNNRLFGTNGISPTLNTIQGGNRQPKIANTLDANYYKGNSVSSERKIRRLTPTECERLQGYPDGWTEGVSDTQRYKTLGNSVTVNVIQAIAEKLL